MSPLSVSSYISVSCFLYLSPSLPRVESADLCVLMGDLSVVDHRLVEAPRPLSLSQLAHHLLQSYGDDK